MEARLSPGALLEGHWEYFKKIHEKMLASSEIYFEKEYYKEESLIRSKTHPLKHWGYYRMILRRVNPLLLVDTSLLVLRMEEKTRRRSFS